MILDLFNCQRVRLENSSQFYQATPDFVQILFNMRRMIELRSEVIEMSYASLSKICGRDISDLQMNKYFKSGFILGYSNQDDFKCYGNSEMIFQDASGHAFVVPKLYTEQLPDTLYQKFIVGREYYVYIHYVDGVPSYIGKGIKDRMQTSRESLIKSNNLYNSSVKSVKIASNLTEKDAFDLESAYMRAVYMSDGKLLNSAMSKELAKDLLDKQNIRSKIEMEYYNQSGEQG